MFQLRNRTLDAIPSGEPLGQAGERGTAGYCSL
jgi:hypothetical protein